MDIKIFQSAGRGSWKPLVSVSRMLQMYAGTFVFKVLNDVLLHNKSPP